MVRETDGSINAGGEFGRARSHAFRVALDDPDPIAACVLGDYPGIHAVGLWNAPFVG